MNQIRIAFITDKIAPFSIGGYEYRTFRLAKSITNEYDVRIFTSLNRNSDEIHGLRFERLLPLRGSVRSSGGRRIWHSLWFGIKLLKNPFNDWAPDVVIVEAIPYFHLVAMRSWVRRLNARKILLVDEAWVTNSLSKSPFNRPVEGVVRGLLSQGIKWADVVIAASGTTAKSLRTNYGVGHPVVIPNGIDLHESPNPRPSFPVKDIDVITVGRLVGYKRQIDLVRALSRLKSRHGWNGRAVIVGDGPTRLKILREVKRRGLEEAISLVGNVPEHAKWNLLRRSRVFVLCSEREGSSISTMEAMAMGLPCILARPGTPEVNGQSDYFEEGVHGSYFRVGDVEDLSRQLFGLISDPVKRSQLGSHAATDARRLDWSVSMRKFRELIECFSG